MYPRGHNRQYCRRWGFLLRIVLRLAFLGFQGIPGASERATQIKSTNPPATMSVPPTSVCHGKASPNIATASV